MSDFTAVVALLALGAVTCIVRTSKGMGDVETYETCGRNHRRSSRFVHPDHRHHVHRIHHRNHPVDHRNHHRLVVLHIHRPLGSYGQCDRSLSTVLILSTIQGSNQQLQDLPCSTLGIHHHRMRIHRLHVQLPRQLGWCSHERCDLVDRTCSKSCPLVPLGTHGLQYQLAKVLRIIVGSLLMCPSPKIAQSYQSHVQGKSVFRHSPPQL